MNQKLIEEHARDYYRFGKVLPLTSFGLHQARRGKASGGFKWKQKTNQ